MNYYLNAVDTLLSKCGGKNERIDYLSWEDLDNIDKVYVKVMKEACYGNSSDDDEDVRVVMCCGQFKTPKKVNKLDSEGNKVIDNNYNEEFIFVNEFHAALDKQCAKKFADLTSLDPEEVKHWRPVVETIAVSITEIPEEKRNFGSSYTRIHCEFERVENASDVADVRTIKLSRARMQRLLTIKTKEHAAKYAKYLNDDEKSFLIDKGLLTDM